MPGVRLSQGGWWSIITAPPYLNLFEPIFHSRIAFIEALKRGVQTPLDVYDAATWSVISTLSERSVAEGGSSQKFPDFTGGKWVHRKPDFAFTDEY